jgi:uncharacterized protein RhaS with RHS repeats
MKKTWVSYKNENGKVIKMVYGDNENIIEYTYNDKGSMTGLTSTKGSWAKYEYDKNNNCISIEEDNGYWQKSEFNDNGDLLWQKNSKGGWINKEYKDLGNGITESYLTMDGGYWETTRYNDDYILYLENSNKITINKPRKRFKPSIQ